MQLEIGIEAGAGQTVRVELVPRRHGSLAEERAVVVDEIPAAPHDAEQAFQLRVSGGAVQRLPADIALPPVERVEKAARLHELVHHAALARGEPPGMERHLDALPAGEALGFVVKWASAGIHVLRWRDGGNRQQGGQQADGSMRCLHVGLTESISSGAVGAGSQDKRSRGQGGRMPPRMGGMAA